MAPCVAAACGFEDVDLAAGKIHVRRGWDVVEGIEVATKSRRARRVPVALALRDHLDEHLLGLVVARAAGGACIRVDRHVAVRRLPRARGHYGAAGGAEGVVHANLAPVVS
jgi:integrase